MPATQHRPPRLLSICADDYGLSPGISDGIAELAMARRLTTVSCITNAPHWHHAGTKLQAFADVIGVGLHFNLTEGNPLSGELAAVWPQLPTLPMLILRAHLGLIPHEAIGCEFAAQWTSFADAAGRQPMFVDGHQHVHHLPGVRTAVFKALDAMQVRPAFRNTARVIGPGFTLKRWLIRHTGGRRLEAELRRRNLPHNSCLLGTYDFTGADYRSRMQAWLGALPDSGGLIYCHPGHDQGGDGNDPVAGARVRELSYLSSAAFQQDLAAANVTLVRTWQ
jgi:predicted glycoside hydrolase/deacetylase ChbG (UPF0249 family)